MPIMAVINRLFILAKATFFLFAIFLVCYSPIEVYAAESEGLYSAIEAVKNGNATPGQQAVVFAANREINYMRQNGVITNSQYQKCQEFFDIKSQSFAKVSSDANNGIFTLQASKSPKYKEGTDSDYILKMKGKDPVQDIRRIQDSYNTQVNDFLRPHKQALAKAGLSTKPRYNWHNKLDVDFMVDPKTVTLKEFQQVAKLNNDAYTRPGAAKYEFVTRGGEGELTSQDFKDYSDEMRDFIQKKQIKLAKLRKNPSLLNDPMQQADYFRIMAQEQKYIDRTQVLVDNVRKKYGIKGPKYGGGGDPYYEMIIDPVKGTATLKRRLPGKLAAHGAVREHTNFKVTAAASSVATNSIRNSQMELAETIAQVGRTGNWNNAAKDIADITKDFPPSEKGRLIEKLGKTRGKVFASEVAKEMRSLVPPRQQVSFVNKVASKLDGIPKLIPGYNDDLSQVSAARAGLNIAAQKAVGLYGMYTTAKTYHDIAKLGSSYWDKIRRATDPGTTDEEAQELFDQASEISWQMAKTGSHGAAMTAMFAKTPTLAALHTSYTIGRAGGDYFFNNTKTGKYILANSLRATEATVDRYGRGMDLLEEFTGGTSQRMIDRQRADLLEEKFRKQIELGNVVLNQDVHIDDVIELIRKGEYTKAKALYKRPNAKGQKPKTSEGKNSQTAKKKKTKSDDIWIYQSNYATGKKPKESVRKSSNKQKLTADQILDNINKQSQPTYRAPKTQKLTADQILDNISKQSPSADRAPKTQKLTADQILDNIGKRSQPAHRAPKTQKLTAGQILDNISKQSPSAHTAPKIQKLTADQILDNINKRDQANLPDAKYSSKTAKNKNLLPAAMPTYGPDGNGGWIQTNNYLPKADNPVPMPNINPEIRTMTGTTIQQGQNPGIYPLLVGNQLVFEDGTRISIGKGDHHHLEGNVSKADVKAKLNKARLLDKLRKAGEIDSENKRIWAQQRREAIARERARRARQFAEEAAELNKQINRYAADASNYYPPDPDPYGYGNYSGRYSNQYVPPAPMPSFGSGRFRPARMPTYGSESHHH